MFCFDAGYPQRTFHEDRGHPRFIYICSKESRNSSSRRKNERILGFVNRNPHQMSICSCYRAVISPVYSNRILATRRRHFASSTELRRVSRIRASMVDSYESSSDFSKRIEQAWLISQQPRPVMCSSCNSNGHVECKWCSGTGFFILGDNMLCQVPSRNTSCVICSGKGSTCCSDCKGTGFRAKWLGKASPSK